MKVLGFRHGGLLIKVVRVPDTNAVNIYFQPSQIFGLCYPGPGGSNVIYLQHCLTQDVYIVIKPSAIGLNSVKL